jgi:hypothetical protein
MRGRRLETSRIVGRTMGVVAEQRTHGQAVMDRLVSLPVRAPLKRCSFRAPESTGKPASSAGSNDSTVLDSLRRVAFQRAEHQAAELVVNAGFDRQLGLEGADAHESVAS